MKFFKLIIALSMLVGMQSSLLLGMMPIDTLKSYHNKTASDRNLNDIQGALDALVDLSEYAREGGKVTQDDWRLVGRVSGELREDVNRITKTAMIRGAKIGATKKMQPGTRLQERRPEAVTPHRKTSAQMQSERPKAANPAAGRKIGATRIQPDTQLQAKKPVAATTRRKSGAQLQSERPRKSAVGQKRSGRTGKAPAKTPVTLNQRLNNVTKEIMTIATSSSTVKDRQFYVKKMNNLLQEHIKLNDLLQEYIISKNTKGITDTDTIINSDTAQLFIDAYNSYWSAYFSQFTLIALDEKDFNRMQNKNILGAALFIPEMTIDDYNRVLKGRFGLALGVKNISTNNASICNNFEGYFKNLTVTKSLGSLDFADQYDINNKNILQNACK